VYGFGFPFAINFGRIPWDRHTYPPHFLGYF